MTGTSLTFGGKPAVMGIVVDISEKKKLQGQLIQSEKLASIGQLVSGVAHELNNPLASIMGYAQLFSENEEIPEKERVTARKMFNSTQRCKKIIQNLLSFASKKEIEQVTLDVDDIVDLAIEFRQYSLGSNDIKVRRSRSAAPKMALGDPQGLQSVFLNLINNAYDAMRESDGGGVLQITTRIENGNIIVEFADDGPGVPIEICDKIFDPFFSTKEVGEGTGLGLSISYGIMKEHGGGLVLDKSFSGGSRFIARLPSCPVEKDEGISLDVSDEETKQSAKPNAHNV